MFQIIGLSRKLPNSVEQEWSANLAFLQTAAFFIPKVLFWSRFQLYALGAGNLTIVLVQIFSQHQYWLYENLGKQNNLFFPFPTGGNISSVFDLGPYPCGHNWTKCPHQSDNEQRIPFRELLQLSPFLLWERSHANQCQTTKVLWSRR